MGDLRSGKPPAGGTLWGRWLTVREAMRRKPPVLRDHVQAAYPRHRDDGEEGR